MPTGYTAKLYEGEEPQTFPEFALQCARAFGALISMKEDPFDAEIPEEIEPYTWHARELEKATAKLADLKTMTPTEIAAAIEVEYARAYESVGLANRTRQARRARYEAMIAEIEAWEPPTEEHVNLKKFMLEQLNGDLRYEADDLALPPRKTVLEWRTERIRAIKRDIEYHTKEDAEERVRAASRTAWIRELRDSLDRTGACG